MAYPVVSVRSRVLPEEPQGPGFLEAGATALLGVLERDRAERHEAEALAAERQHSRSMVELQDTLLRGRDREQFDRERPFMETPGQQRLGARETAEHGSALRRQEDAFSASLRAPAEKAQRDFQERDFSYRTLRDQLDYNLRVAGQQLDERTETRLNERAAGPGGAGGAAGGIPASVWSTLFSSEQISPDDLVNNPEALKGLDVLDQYLRGVPLPQIPTDTTGAGSGEATQGPGFWRGLGNVLTPGQPFNRNPEPGGRATGAGSQQGAAVLGPRGTGAGPGVLSGGGPNTQRPAGPRDPKYPEAEWFSRQSSDIVGSSGIFPDDVMRRLSVEDHIKFLNDVLIPDGDTPAQYIERLFEIDPRIAEQVQRRLGGGR